MIKRLLFFTVLLCICSTSHAQISLQKTSTDSVTNALFPVFAYSSTTGFLGGALYSRYDYRGNTTPFKNYINSSAVVSTNGYIKANGLFEQTNSFGTDIRSSINGFIYRFAKDNFFGIGNNTGFNDDRWDDEFYYFKSVSFGLEYEARKPLYRQSWSRLDAFAGMGTQYQIPYVRQDNSSFNRVMPNGSKGGWVNYLSTGLVWDSRDNEFDPRHGSRAKLEVRLAPALVSEYGLTTFRLDLRKYFHFFDFITIAQRLQGRHAEGDIPYWELSTLGNDFSLRGYPMNRFQGNSSISYSLELRSWLIQIPEYGFKLGGQFFTDIGRVFTERDDIGDLFENYKQTFGFGGAVSLFNPDFILRGDIGFSDDVSRIYVGVGYTF